MSLEKENRVHPCTRLFSIKEQLFIARQIRQR